jgi:hypothetical protein
LGVSALETLRPKAKAPNSCRTLDAWVNLAERELGVRGGRVGWLVATTLVKRLMEDADSPSEAEVAHAVEDIFSSRAHEAELQGTAVRRNPCPLCECRRWTSDYPDASASAGLDISLDDAINEVNAWLVRIGVLGNE